MMTDVLEELAVMIDYHSTENDVLRKRVTELEAEVLRLETQLMEKSKRLMNIATFIFPTQTTTISMLGYSKTQRGKSMSRAHTN